MSLVLAGPDSEPAARLFDQLIKLGYLVQRATDMQVVMNLCEHSVPDTVIVGQLEQALSLADEHPRVPVVLAQEERAETDLLLDALRCGLSDVWTLPMADADVSERLEAVAARHQAIAADAERRLGRAVADLERDQRAGRYIQLGMLPPNPMAIDGYRLRHHILPSLILSGDFVDYFRISDRHFAFYVADVSGHGASSAFVTVLLKNFSRRLRREFRPSMLNQPGEILEWINRELLEQDMDKHVALLLGVGDLERDEIRLVNGGHYPPAILNRDGASEFVEQKGKPVGLFDEVAYVPEVIRLERGDRLVMFSDGVLDVMGADDLAGKEQRLLRAATEGGSVEEMWSLLDMDLNVGNRPDDMTCLVVQRET